MIALLIILNLLMAPALLPSQAAADRAQYLAEMEAFDD